MIILGAGGMAREICLWENSYFSVFFEEEDYNTDSLLHLGHPVINDLSKYKDMPFKVGTGNPLLNKRLFFTALENGLIPAPLNGCAIAPTASISVNVSIGRGCIINTFSAITHDVKIGDFCVISPGAIIGGRSELGEGVFVGMSAVIHPGVKIGDYATIGMGSVVIRDVLEGSTVVGNPAKEIKK